MYFKSRADAGRQLAEQLKSYADQQCYIVALSEGAVIVAAQIAMKVHANIGLLLSEDYDQRNNINTLAALGPEHIFNYNMRPAGSFEFDTTDDGGQSSNRTAVHRNSQAILGPDGDIRRKLMHQHVVIVVSDGFNNGVSLDMASTFLQSTVLKKLIVATPLASYEALNRIHMAADEIVCLNVVEEYQGTDHYYENNTVPQADGLFKMVREIALLWKRE